MPVTPFAGYNTPLTRAPYVTDLTQTSADVTWATSASALGTLQWGPEGDCTEHVAPVPKALPTLVPSTNSPASATSLEYSANSVKEYQSTVVLSGLSASSTYCYEPFSGGIAPVSLLGSNPAQSFTTLDSLGSTAPLTFDVTGDLGETQETPGTNYPGDVNPDQAAIQSEIGSSGARFVVLAGDVAYPNGSQTNYGDLQQTGTDVSDIFGPSYWPETKGMPTFNEDGDHGQSVTGLRVWPESNTASTDQPSAGTYAYEPYPAGADGTSATTNPDTWYAIQSGNVRIYMLEAAWNEDSNLGNADGAACGAAGSKAAEACETYQIDYDKHWTVSSPEYQWLQADLAAHPGGIKMAVFHYPIRSDNSTQPSDDYLQNTSANPNQSTSLEKLLATNGVALTFSGHAHTYQRSAPDNYGSADQVVNYVTGGGGGILEPVQGGSTCTNLMKTESIYALGWDPGTGKGSYCGPGSISASTPTTAAQVYNYLQVQVSGDTVTVTPYNAADQPFDQQTYTYSSSTPPPPPPTPTTPGQVTAAASSSTDVALTWSPSTESGGTIASYQIDRNGASLATVGGTATSFNDGTVQPSTDYTYTVTAIDANNVDSSPGSSNEVTTPASTPASPLVQIATGTETAAATSLTATFPAATTAGDLLVLSVSKYTGSGYPTTVTDSDHDKWTEVPAALRYSTGHNSDGEMWYLADAGPVSSVTVTTTAAVSMAVEAEEFSGVAATSPLDVSTGTSASSTTANSGSVTPAAAGELAVGFVAGHANSEAISVPPSPAFTVQPQLTTIDSTTTLVTGYQVLSGTGSQYFSATFKTAMYWAAGIAIFASRGSG